MKLNDFLPRASSEQRKIIGDLRNLGKQESIAWKNYNKQQQKIDDELRWIRSQHSQPMLVDMIAEEDVDPLLPGRDKAAATIRQIRGQIGTKLREAVEYGMGYLGLVQKHYESYVGEPMPQAM